MRKIVSVFASPLLLTGLLLAVPAWAGQATQALADWDAAWQELGPEQRVQKAQEIDNAFASTLRSLEEEQILRIWNALSNPITRQDMANQIGETLWQARHPGTTSKDATAAEWKAQEALIDSNLVNPEALRQMLLEVYDRLLLTGKFDAIMRWIESGAAHQARRAALARPNTSAKCSVTATVAANSNLAAAFSGCEETFTVQFAKLPVAISEELLRQAGRRGAKTGFDLSAPFLRWLIRTDRFAYDDSGKNSDGHKTGAGQYSKIEAQVFFSGQGSCHVTIEGDTAPDGTREMCFILLKLARLVSQGELETLLSLINGYLDSTVHAAPASPTATELPR